MVPSDDRSGASVAPARHALVAPHETAGAEWGRWSLGGDLLDVPTGSARMLKIEVDGGRNKIHDALLAEWEINKDGSRTYQRVWPLVTAHSNGVPFLLFDAARRFVRAHASFMMLSTVSVNGQKLLLG